MYMGFLQKQGQVINLRLTDLRLRSLDFIVLVHIITFDKSL